MSLYAFQNPPGFATGNDLHATDGVQILWDNARVLDLASLATRELFCGHADHRHEYINANPLTYYWRGGFRYRTGLTTLTVSVDRALLGTGVAPRVRAHVNGVTRIDAALTAGLNSYSVSGMGSWGLVNGDVAEVRIDIFDPAAPQPTFDETPNVWGRYYLADAYVSPASAIHTTAWPGVPTFTTSPDEARLVQLGNAGVWLAQRMAACPVPLFQRLVSSPDLPWWTPQPDEPIRHLWSGGGVRGPYDRISARVVWVKGSATNQRIRMLINGSEVATTANISAGGWNHTFDVNISGYSSSAPLRVELELVITTGAEAGGYPNRLSVDYVEFRRASPPLQTMSNRPVSWEQTDWATRKSRLNAIAGWLNTIKSRIDADSDRWDRIRLFRGSYAYEPGEAEYLKGRHHAVRRARTGTRLIVRGTNIKLGWGPLGATLNDPKEPFGEYSFTWGFEETLVSGSEVQTREVQLDALPGLLPGMLYQVYGGDVRYAGEEQR